MISLCLNKIKLLLWFVLYLLDKYNPLFGGSWRSPKSVKRFQLALVMELILQKLGVGFGGTSIGRNFEARPHITCKQKLALLKTKSHSAHQIEIVLRILLRQSSLTSKKKAPRISSKCLI